jgi:tRNA (guanosine-2'-O-)-methyltransferase
MKQLRGTELKRLHRDWQRQTPGRLALLLDAVQSPWNVGAIVRTAAAYRVEHLWLSGGSTPPTHHRSKQLSLGTERYLTWSEADSAAAAATQARNDGYQVVGVELAAGAVPLHELALATDVCLAFGNEDHGLGPAALAGCDAVAFLPQLGRVGSLNVATAAAVAMYEVRRRAWTERPAPAGNEPPTPAGNEPQTPAANEPQTPAANEPSAPAGNELPAPAGADPPEV